MSICSQGEALGGIAERPLTAIFPYNGLRGRDTCRWSFLLITRFTRQNRGLCPHPAGATAPAPGLPGALPPDPHTRRCRQQPEHQKMSRLRRILYVSLPVKGRSAIPPKASPCEHMLTFPLDSSPICSKTEEMSVFEGLFLETFFSNNILVMSFRKYIFVFSSLWKKGVKHMNDKIVITRYSTGCW